MFGAPALPGSGHYDPGLAGGSWGDPTRSGSPQLDYNDSRAIIAAAQAAAAAGKPPKRVPTLAVKPAGRTRPTNNQLLYKAYFRWDHYCHKIHAGPTLPDETEACASVTSAFLQVLSTLHAAESRRVDKPRNILQILSTNTRRTKVVELSSGTHRVADELRRHCLTDGEAGQYSTNLDRNRYGNDDQYLSTVIRYDLEFLDLCPCLVDVEIIDAKQGNESTLVSAGPDMCNCDGQPRKAQPAAATTPVQPQQVPAASVPVEREAVAPPAPKQSWHPPPTAAVSGERGGGAGSGRLYAPVAQHPTQSRGTHASGGSDLFDALLMAATGGTETAQAPSAGEPPVTSKMHGSLGGLPRQRSRLWHTPASMGEVDSLQNALEAWKADEEIASGQHALDNSSPFRRVPSRRRLPRKGSYSNFNALEDNSQGGATGGPGGAAASGAAAAGGGALDGAVQGGGGVGGGGIEASGAGGGKERSGENGPATSVRSQEGDTEVANRPAIDDGAEGVEDGSGPLQRGIIRSVHRQSSAVNLASLSRLGKDAEIKRLQDECRMLQDEVKSLEGSLEEARTRELQASSKADSLRMELDRSHTQGHQYLEQVNLLRAEVFALRSGAAPGSVAATAPLKHTSSDAGTVERNAGANGGSSDHTRSEGDAAATAAGSGGGEALQRELSQALAAMQRLEADKQQLEAKFKSFVSLWGAAEVHQRFDAAKAAQQQAGGFVPPGALFGPAALLQAAAAAGDAGGLLAAQQLGINLGILQQLPPEGTQQQHPMAATPMAYADAPAGPAGAKRKADGGNQPPAKRHGSGQSTPVANGDGGASPLGSAGGGSAPAGEPARASGVLADGALANGKPSPNESSRSGSPSAAAAAAQQGDGVPVAN